MCGVWCGVVEPEHVLVPGQRNKAAAWVPGFCYERDLGRNCIAHGTVTNNNLIFLASLIFDEWIKME